MQNHLSPRQFAEAIGVSEASVRRWADSGRIRMTRTAGGHRKIARPEAIRFIRETSQDVVRPDLLEINEPKRRHQRAAAFEAQHEELLAALREGDAEMVFGLVSRMYVNGVTAAEICDGPIRNAMYKIGMMWPNEKHGILIEHRATNIVIEVLNRLRSTFPRLGKNAPIAVGGAPERDPFALPSLMVTTVLADLGYTSVNLGPNTPIKVIAQSAVDLNALLAWVSFSSPLSRTKVNEDLLGAATKLRRKKVQLILGGRVANRYQLPPGKHVHSFPSLAELAGFAKAAATVI